MNGRIVRQDEGGLCTLILNRPEKLNALDSRTFKDLDDHLSVLETETGRIGCVVLRGSGRGFCAGADLQALEAEIVSDSPVFKPTVIERLGRLPQPVIAAVHGVCFTGGLELALGCDFIVADGSASFSDTHGKWGLLGGWGMSQRLPRRVGIPQAKRMTMTACRVHADEAKAIGLVDLVAPAGELDALIASFTGEILLNSWHTNFATKRLMRETDGLSLAAGLAHEHYRYPGLAPDYAERIASFGKK
jgi:enoyl-CoA hydratase/carnithine racemase